MKLRSSVRLVISVTFLSVIPLSFGLAAKLNSINSGISFGTGAGLAIVNSAAGLMIIDKSISKNTLTFLKIVLLSMGVRMVVLFFSLILLIKLIGTQVVPLVSGLLIYYFVMTIYEIVFVNKRANLQKALKVNGGGA